MNEENTFLGTAIRSVLQLADEVRAARKPGGTLQLGPKPVDPSADVVTLSSVNLSGAPGDTDWERVYNLVYPYAAELSLGRLVLGVYAFTGGGISVDLNVAVPRRFRRNTLDFARANGQEAIWAGREGKCLPAGGDGNSVLGDPFDVRRAALALLDGQPVRFPNPVGC